MVLSNGAKWDILIIKGAISIIEQLKLLSMTLWIKSPYKHASSYESSKLFQIDQKSKKSQINFIEIKYILK